MLTLFSRKPTNAPRVRDELCDVLPDLKNQIKFNPDGTEFYFPDSVSPYQDAAQVVIDDHDPNAPRELSEEEINEKENQEVLDALKRKSLDDWGDDEVKQALWALVQKS